MAKSTTQSGRSRVSRHRAVIVYVVLVLVVVAALVGYERHTNANFDRADRISCDNRRVLFANQRLVLRYLHAHSGRSVDPRSGLPWSLEFSESLDRAFSQHCP